MKTKKIMVPLDGSEVAESALADAFDLAGRDWGVVVLMRAAEAHVLPGRDPILAQIDAVAEAEKYMADLTAKLERRGIRNVGMYRIMQTGRDTLAMHWQRHKVGAAHWREMAERGETMPVCIAIGADPPSMYSASAPLPPTIDEFLFAGFLRRSPVMLTKAVTNDLEVPAEADFVNQYRILSGRIPGGLTRLDVADPRTAWALGRKPAPPPEA